MEISLVSSTASSFFSTFMHCYLFPQVFFSCYITFLGDLIHTDSFNYNTQAKDSISLSLVQMHFLRLRLNYLNA